MDLKKMETDFKEMSKAHVLWKVKLAEYFQLANGSLHSTEVAAPDKCALGKWIYYGEGKNYSDFPEYNELEEIHKKFHSVTAEIIEDLNQGKPLDKEQTLGFNSMYDNISLQVTQGLLSMQRAIVKNETEESFKNRRNNI